MAVRRELFAGEVLYRQGEPAESAWLIESGEIELSSLQAGRKVSQGVFGAGEMLGEVALLDDSPHTATAAARSESVLLEIDHEQFDERLNAADPVVRTLVGNLLRYKRSVLANLPADAPLPAEDVACSDAEERSGIDKIRLEAELREALDTGALEVGYQPLYDFPAGRVTGYEALVRWNSPRRGPVSPAQFIKLAEETSLIVPIGEHVLEHVLDVLTQLRDRGGEPVPSIAVNLSARQLTEPGMAQQVISRVQRAQLPPGALKLEITESGMLDYASVAAVMQHCRAQGIPFALDDFGTGYSNLTHLHELEFEFVKVDQAFVRQMFDGARAMAIVQAIIAMAHTIGAEVVCEGVETREQLQRLAEMGVRYAQGYLVGKAAPREAVLSGEAARFRAGPAVEN
jgi:EAL domain-containing protein (putative c-di-GMP-specific phosphodiesterase class I)